MCNPSDHPPYDDIDFIVDSRRDSTIVESARCDELLWIGGTQRVCGQTVGLRSWADASGRVHFGCHRHVVTLQHRWPAR